MEKDPVLDGYGTSFLSSYPAAALVPGPDFPSNVLMYKLHRGPDWQVTKERLPSAGIYLRLEAFQYNMYSIIQSYSHVFVHDIHIGEIHYTFKHALTLNLFIYS